MKKTLIFWLAQIFAVSSIFAQSAEITITPRFEGELTKPQSEKADIGFGMSSLYGFVDGTFRNENFSYSASVHLLSSSPKDLYNYEAPFASGTWLDWAYLSYDGELFGGSLGKMCLNTGLTEFDSNDVDCFSPLVSSVWNSFTVYQWGGAFRFTPWETQCFEAQFLTSPQMDKLSNKDFAWSVAWRGEFGRFSTFWSLNQQRYTVDYNHHGFVTMVGFGNTLTLDHVKLSLDITNGGFDGFSDWSRSEFTARVDWFSNDMFKVGATVGLQRFDQLLCGFKFLYYPLKNDTLRIHASLSRRGYQDIYQQFSENYLMASLGITYNLHINL